MRDEMTEERLAAISQMRAISEKFIAGELAFDDFFSQMSPYLGGVFDPLDWQLEGLDSCLQDEVRFYSKHLGGEFGEHDVLLPKQRGGRAASVRKYRTTYAKEYRRMRKA